MQTLRIARLLLGVSVEDLAREAEVSVRELHRVERGTVRPHIETLARLDEALVRMLHGRRKLATREGT